MTARDAGVEKDPTRLVPTKEQRLDALKRAADKIAEYDWYPVDMYRLQNTLREFNVFGAEAIREALASALKEITPEDYRGAFPPETSYEEVVEGASLFAFAWKSDSFSCSMYLKFCFHEDDLYIVTFHQQRKRA